MHRPGWHDAAIAVCIAALLAAGVWALWGDELRGRSGASEAPIDPSGL